MMIQQLLDKKSVIVIILVVSVILTWSILYFGKSTIPKGVNSYKLERAASEAFVVAENWSIASSLANCTGNGYTFVQSPIGYAYDPVVTTKHLVAGRVIVVATCDVSITEKGYMIRGVPRVTATVVTEVLFSDGAAVGAKYGKSIKIDSGIFEKDSSCDLLSLAIEALGAGPPIDGVESVWRGL